MADGPQVVPTQPVTEQVVTVERLKNYQPINPTAFSGEADPTQIWRAMITDTVSSFKFYRDIEEKDTVVGSLLQLRRDSVLSRKRNVIPASDAPEDKARANFAIEALAAIPAFDEVLDELLDAPAYGVTIAEILWKLDGGQVLIEDILAVPQEFFSFGNKFDSSQAGSLRFVGPDQTLDQEMPDHKFVVFTFRPRNGNRRGRPLLRTVFWDSWSARQIQKFMLQHSEKGNGTVAVKYPEGADEKERGKALDAAVAIYEDPTVAISANLQIVFDLLEKARSGSVPDYLARLDHLNAKVTRRIIGQTLTTQGAEQGAGSRALGEVHKDTFQTISVADAKRVERIVNDQVIKPLMIFNFGPGVPLPKYEIDKSEPVDQTTRVTTYRTLVEMGLPVRFGQARRELGIEEPQPDDELLERGTVPADLGFPGDTTPPGGTAE